MFNLTQGTPVYAFSYDVAGRVAQGNAKFRGKARFTQSRCKPVLDRINRIDRIFGTTPLDYLPLSTISTFPLALHPYSNGILSPCGFQLGNMPPILPNYVLFYAIGSESSINHRQIPSAKTKVDLGKRRMAGLPRRLVTA